MSDKKLRNALMKIRRLLRAHVGERGFEGGAYSRIYRAHDIAERVLRRKP